jgi:hypothetical protein
MGLFFWKGIENSAFRQRSDGDWDFFPNGVIGRGYRVTAAQREELRHLLRRQYGVIGIVLLPTILVQAFFHTLSGKALVFAAALLVLLPFFLLFRAQRRRIIGVAPPAEKRLTLDEAQQATAEHLPKARVVLLLVLGALMTLMGVFVMWSGIRDGDVEELLIGVLALLFFGFCSWMGVRMWRKRRRFLAAGGHVPRVFD